MKYCSQTVLTPVQVTLHIVENRTVHWLQFVTISTYLQFKGGIYKQKKGFALLAFMSVFLMEDLEARAIKNSPYRMQQQFLDKVCRQHTGDN